MYKFVKYKLILHMDVFIKYQSKFSFKNIIKIRSESEED